MIPRVRFVISSIALAAIVAVAAGSDTFHPGPASDYAHQTSELVTIGAKSFGTAPEIAGVFGKKVDLLKYGVLPVLVVIENKRQKTIDLRDLEVNLVAVDGRHATPVNPEDVMFLGTAGRRPREIPSPIPLPNKKNPLNAPEIITRAFSAKVLPPGDSSAGFFYFQAKPEQGDSLYVNGLRDTPSEKEIMYFEFAIK